MQTPRNSGLKAPTSRLTRPSVVATPSSTGSANAAQKSSFDIRAQPAEPASTSSTDGYKVGDRIWVGGARAGTIAFIGETSFSTGVWAGVVLGAATGKNDGSVSGVRYFQCDPKCGVFSRLSKLTKYPVDNTVSISAGAPSGNTSVVNTSVPSFRVPPPPRSMSGRSLVGGVAPYVPLGSLSASSIKLGDHVIVSNTKRGILRYLGTTDFAKGEWAGVDLIDPQGKNDGSVSGKRYFTCKANHGLFAPRSKVVKVAGQSTSGIVTSPRRAGLSRSGSQESISSIGSAISSVSTRSNRQTAASKRLSQGRPSLTSSIVGNLALQKTLKEKNDHIDELLREKESVREEFMVSREIAKQKDLQVMQKEVDLIQEDHQKTVEQLNCTIEKMKDEQIELLDELDSEKKKVENMSFSMEEKNIVDEDIEKQLETKLDSVEKELSDSKKEITMLKLKLQDKTSSPVSEDQDNSLNEKIKNLKIQLDVYKKKVEDMDSKDKKIKEMEDLLKKSKIDQALLQDKIIAVEKTNKKHIASNAVQSQEFTSKINDYEETIKKSEQKYALSSEHQADLESRLNNALEAHGDAGKLAGELNAQINEKQRQLEEYRDALSFRESQISGEMGDIGLKMADSEVKVASLTSERDDLTSKVGSLTSEIEQLTSKIAVLSSESTDFTSKLEMLATEKDDLSSNVNKLTSEKEMLTSEKAALASELSSMTSSVSTLTDDLQRLSAEKETENEKLSSLQDSTTKEIEKNVNLLKVKDEELINIKNSETISKEKISNLEEEIQNLIQNSGNSNEQIKVVNDKLCRVESELAESKENLLEFQRNSKQDSLDLADQYEFNLVECKTIADNKLESQIKEFNKTIEDNVSMISNLTEELNGEKTKNLESSSQNEKLNSTNNSLLDEINLHKKNIKEFEEKNLVSEKTICEQKEHNSQLEKKIDDLLKNSGDSNEQLNSLNSKLVSVERDCQKWKESLDKSEQNSKKEISDLKEQFEFDFLECQSKSEINLKTSEEAFNKQIEEKDSLIVALNSKIDFIKTENTENSLTIEKLKLESEFNSENVKTQLNKMKEVEEKSKYLEEKMSEDNERNSELTIKLEMLTSKEEESQNKVNSLNDKLQILESELAKGKLDLLESQNSSANDVRIAKQQFQLELSESKQSADTQVSSLKEQQSNLIKEKAETIISLNNEIEVLNTCKSDLNKKYDGLILENESMNEKNKMQMMSIDDIEEKLKISAAKNIQLEEKNCEINLRIETLMKNSGDSCEQLNCLNDKLSLAEKSLTNTQDLLSQTKCEMEHKLTSKDQKFNELQEKYEIEQRNLSAKNEEIIKERDNQYKSHETTLKKALETVDNHKTEIKLLSENLKILETKNNNYETNIENLEKHSKELEAKEINLKSENMALEKKLNDQNMNNNENLDKQLSENKKKHEAILSKLENDMENKLKSVNSDFEIITSKKDREILNLNNDHEKIINEKNKKLQILESDLSKLKVQMLESSTKIKDDLNINLQEKDNVISSLQENIKTSNLEVDEFKNNARNLEKQIASLQDKLTTLNSNNDNSESIKTKEIVSLNSKVSQLDNALSDKDNEIQRINLKVEEFKELSTKLENVNKNNLQELENSNKQIALYKLQMTEAKEKVEKLHSICQEQTLAYEKENEECKKWSSSCAGIKNELETIMPKFLELEEQVKLRDFQILELNSKLEDISFIPSPTVPASSANKDQLVLLTKENGKLKEENLQLQIDLSEQRNSCEVLQESVNAMSSKTKSPQYNTSSTSKEDKNLIEFLNSIIAEYKQKNDSLQEKIDILMNTTTTTSSTFAGTNLNDSSTERNNVAVRKFCDICEEFDLHETEDCPKQCNDSEDDIAHSHHQGDANSSRLYCESCEVFGHTIDNCNDQETF